MSKREKIIVCLMIGSVVFGAYHFRALYSSKINLKALSPQNIENTIKNIKEPEIVLSEKEQYILKQAPVPWGQDPFIAPISQEQKQLKKPVLPPVPKDLKYSGYMKMGDRILAIIDGMEYQVGETLLKSQYMIADISPRQVVIALPGGFNSGTVFFRTEE